MIISKEEKKKGCDQGVKSHRGLLDVNSVLLFYLGGGYIDSFKLIVFCTFKSDTMHFKIPSVFKRNSEYLIYSKLWGLAENRNWRIDRINTSKYGMEGISKDMNLHGPKKRFRVTK